jgi:hypothetical protein
MKRTLLAFLLAGALMAAAYGSAATLSVNGGTIQAGEDLNVTCTDQANVLGWGYESDTNDVRSVRLEVHEACAGNALFVNITGTGGAVLFTAEMDPIAEEGCGAVSTDYICVSLGGADGFVITDPEDITDIHIVIEGAGGTPDD